MKRVDVAVQVRTAPGVCQSFTKQGWKPATCSVLTFVKAKGTKRFKLN